MNPYSEQNFTIPELKGISAKTISEHLKLYAGYVKQTNLLLEKMAEFSKDPEKTMLAQEMQRRFSFEFNGMRNHEYYFKSLEGGAAPLEETSSLKTAIAKEWGSFDAWLMYFKQIAMTRGIGWAVLYWDPEAKRLLTNWVEEQHMGHLNSLRYVVGIDMWEHSFYLDYATDKKKYIDAFFENLHWPTVEKNFMDASKENMQQ